MAKTITERGGGRISLPKGRGLEGEVRVMGWEPGATEVEGSSGIYPIKNIVRDFKTSFPEGTRMRANHDGLCEAGGDIRRIVAKTTGIPVRKEKHPDGPGMYAPVIFSEDWSTFAREFGDVIGVSISAAAELEPWPEDQETNAYGEAVDEDGNVLKPTIKRFLSQEESPYNSIDFVEAPGADGRIVSLAVESAKNHVEHMVANTTALREAVTFAKGTIKPPTLEDSEATPPRSNKEEDMLDAEERQTIAKEAAKAAVEAFVAAQPATESAPEQPSLGVLAESIATAGLTEAGRAGVYRRVEAGEAVDAAIAAEKAHEDAIRAELSKGSTVSDESGTGAPLGYTVDEGDKTLDLSEKSSKDFSAEFEEMVG